MTNLSVEFLLWIEDCAYNAPHGMDWMGFTGHSFYNEVCQALIIKELIGKEKNPDYWIAIPQRVRDKFQ